MTKKQGDQNKRINPDVKWVSLQYHADPWSNGALPQMVTFRVMGNGSYPNHSGKWTVHLIEASIPAPVPLAMPVLHKLLTQALEKTLEKEVVAWENNLIGWKDE